MKIKLVDINLVQLNDVEYHLLFDSAGNAYLMSNDKKVYQILLEGNNIIAVYDKEFKFHEYNQQAKKLKLSTDPTSLKGKLIKEKTKEFEEQELEDSEEEMDNDIDIIRQMYPEDLDYYQDGSDNELDEFSDEDNFQFAVVDSADIQISDTDEYTAIYDTIVYNGGYGTSNCVVFKTTYCGIPLPYRLLIFSSGDFIIKTIAEQQIHNKLTIIDNEPCFIQIKNEKIKLNM